MSYSHKTTTDLLVLGAGPGGYSAAFRAADLGKKVILVERGPTLGGVCLNVGCIPSKTLLHAAAVIEEAKHSAAFGVTFTAPTLDIEKLRNYKNTVVRRLTTGLAGLAKQRQVEVINGVGKLLSHNTLEVVLASGEKKLITFSNVIIAAGSEPIKLPFIPEDPRILDSTAALDLKFVPKKLLVIGGGIIGLEMATVYHALGSEITVVELMDQLVPGMDVDVVKPLQQILSKKYANIMLKTKVTKVLAKEEGLLVTFEGEPASIEPQIFDAVLVAVGRTPNGKLIGAENAGVTIDAKGFINVNEKMQTNVPHIYAIGDIVGNPMLAHKASYEGRLAAEIIAGLTPHIKKKHIPGVAYTDPEIATVGLTEAEAQKQGIEYSKGVFPWAASGRSLSLGRNEGLTKLIFTKDGKKLLGAGIVGTNAGELISELAVAIELHAKADNIAHTIHPHPTLSETIMMAAEVFNGTVTDLYLKK